MTTAYFLGKGAGGGGGGGGGRGRGKNSCLKYIHVDQFWYPSMLKKKKKKRQQLWNSIMELFS